jgi:Rieske Fe-S protein
MSVGRILAQGFNYPRRFLGGRLGKGDPTPAAELTPGQGRVLQTPDGKLAVYRDEGSEVHAMSPTCTHLGCVVEFNGAERTWDCPCHGSRYGTDGAVIRGPAKKPLEQRELPEGAAS